MDWVEVALEEYKTLREESLVSMQMQQSILGYGTATLGLVISAGLTVWDKSRLPEIIFMIFVPIIVYLIVLIWAGQVARMFRAGGFLISVENKINSAFQEKERPLSWENWLVSQQSGGKNPHQWLRLHDQSVFMLFSATSIVSVIIGNYKLNQQISNKALLAFDLIELSALFLVAFLSYRMITCCRKY